ncbi:hypothetical protein [Parendozoicomonas haliclonae]|uniref:Uncharacterized protein n=1 Tax=Parendozoicomonas haliclonae TaxID=1960125 RepID=A0A1X7AR62_9GAMM|nr:hypothetical protein [Parendozoicomonas haliclonae]SMA50570.1 hypothetical protein EHSB41UT_04381 [Parendozoicomonas haliclonae]
MNREVRHPFLFTLCGFVLCIMFAGNLAVAQEPRQVYLNMKNIQEYEMYGYVLVYKNPLDHRSTTNLRVFQGGIGVLDVLPGEWVAIDVIQVGTSWRCKTYQNEHRLLMGQGVLSQSVVISPTLQVEGDKGVCRLNITAAEVN